MNAASETAVAERADAQGVEAAGGASTSTASASTRVTRIGFVAPAAPSPVGPAGPAQPAPPSTAFALTGRESARSWLSRRPTVKSQQFDIELGAADAVSPPLAFKATDPEANPLLYYVPARGELGGPQHGSVMLDQAAGTFVYNPDDSFVVGSSDRMTDRFLVRVSDRTNVIPTHGLFSWLRGGRSAYALMTVTFTGIAPPTRPAEGLVPGNRAPVAGGDSFTVGQNATLVGNVLANDTDLDAGDAGRLRAILTVAPANGSFTLARDGSFTYTPNAGFVGNDFFTYRATDGKANSTPSTVTITVTNATPATTADSLSATEDQPLTFTAAGLLANDTDDGPAPLTVQVSAPANGVLTSDGNGGYTYTPNANFNGVDTFTYTASDGHVTSAPVTVTVQVGAVNDAPTASDASFIGAEDAQMGGDLGVVDPDVGDTLTYTLVSGPGNGTVIFDNGQFVYTPNADFNGVDTFVYSVSDGANATSSASVSLTVAPVNDAPTAVFDVLANEFANGDFTNGITGWTALNTRVRMDGTGTVAGWATPVDPTTAPGGGREANQVGAQTYTTVVNGAGRAVLTSDLNDVRNNPAGQGAVVHGPVIVSDDSVLINAGATVQFDWEASGGEDAYDVLGYIVNVDTGETFIMLNETGANANDDQPITVVNHFVTQTGRYRFVFAAGSWDATGGERAGAQLSIDNVRVLDNLSPTGEVEGKVTGADLDGDTVTYSAAATSTKGGTVVIDSTTGAFTYRPTAAALAAARAAGATAAEKEDTFTATVSDGNGGSTEITVTVPVL
ncbi:tandem-95 repeat protein [Mycolicibacterium sp. S2-37]|uniref:Ig-like domain-containing protein n=1 Tax=Mycolicibacterium sp. S2-37 TaxID=2810297 RepID=UPI001A941645|nr:Ig-like domain-containing protein [Mycolicibacterium sp. S2-37]MBO0677821.1 tandem-95 repeat protein [Mycolicibacterium sp. S2-37]